MKKAFDITETRLLLRRMVASGRVTLEQLDTPPPGYKLLVEEMSRHRVVELRSFQVPPYVNPLRDPEPDPVVQVSDPRDFTPTEGATPAQGPDLEVDW